LLSSRTGYYTVIIARTDKPIRTSGLYGLTKCLTTLRRYTTTSGLRFRKEKPGPPPSGKYAIRSPSQLRAGASSKRAGPLFLGDDLRTYRRS
jgi:hypothetical protein